MKFKDLLVIIALIFMSAFFNHYICDQDFSKAINQGYFMSCGAILSWIYNWIVLKDKN